MPTFKKISGKWQECQALVKEGGTWREIGAVTAKANGKWADIAPPKPVGRMWTSEDFTYQRRGISACFFKIRADLPQYFSIGDVFDFNPGDLVDGASFSSIDDYGVPGLYLEKGKLVGTVADVLPPSPGTFRLSINVNGSLKIARIVTSDMSVIPIKPAP